MSARNKPTQKQEPKKQVTKQIEEELRAGVSFDPELLIVNDEQVLDQDMLRISFNDNDKDQDEKLTWNELIELLTSLAGELNAEDVKLLKANYNSAVEESEDKLINFDLFIRLYKVVLKNKKMEKDASDVLNAFKTFDRDNNGVISLAEMKHILESFGENVSDKEIEEIFNEADLNKDGNIDYQEFIQFWKNNFSD